MTVGQNIMSGDLASDFIAAVESWGNEASNWQYGAAFSESFASYFQVSMFHVPLGNFIRTQQWLAVFVIRVLCNVLV